MKPKGCTEKLSNTGLLKFHCFVDDIHRSTGCTREASKDTNTEISLLRGLTPQVAHRSFQARDCLNVLRQIERFCHTQQIKDRQPVWPSKLEWLVKTPTWQRGKRVERQGWTRPTTKMMAFRGPSQSIYLLFHLLDFCI